MKKKIFEKNFQKFPKNWKFFAPFGPPEMLLKGPESFREGGVFGALKKTVILAQLGQNFRGEEKILPNNPHGFRKSYPFWVRFFLGLGPKF